MKIQTTFIKSKQTKFIIKRKKKQKKKNKTILSFHQSKPYPNNQKPKPPKSKIPIPQNTQKKKKKKKEAMFSYLNSKMFKHGGEINQGTGTNMLSVLSSLEKPSNQCAM